MAQPLVDCGRDPNSVISWVDENAKDEWTYRRLTEVEVSLRMGPVAEDCFSSFFLQTNLISSVQCCGLAAIVEKNQEPLEGAPVLMLLHHDFLIALR